MSFYKNQCVDVEDEFGNRIITTGFAERSTKNMEVYSNKMLHCDHNKTGDSCESPAVLQKRKYTKRSK